LPEFKVRNGGSQKAPKGASKTDGCPHAAFFTVPAQIRRYFYAEHWKIGTIAR
jgi:hypothetical protein